MFAPIVAWFAGPHPGRPAYCCCSHRTVQKHLQRLYVKLDVETRTAAVMRSLGA